MARAVKGGSLMQLRDDGPSQDGSQQGAVTSVTGPIRVPRPLLALTPDAAETAGDIDGLELIVETLRDVLSCEAAAIRLLEPDGALPYRAASGFPQSALDDPAHGPHAAKPCVCTEVVHGAYDTSLPCFTENGSFVINTVAERWAIMRLDRAPEFYHLMDTAPQFQSLIVTPLRALGHDLGVIQCADSHPNRFPAKAVTLIESAALEIAQDLFYDSLWQPAVADRRASMTRTPAVCPICGRERDRSGTWRASSIAGHARLLRSTRRSRTVVCPSCMRLCNFE